MENQSEDCVRSPCLLYHSSKKQEHLFCCVSSPHSYIRYRQKIPVLAKKEVCNCAYGWLILRSGASRFMLLNPDTRHIIYLPVLPLQPRRDLDGVILWLPPDNPKSMVLLFDRCRRTIMYCYTQHKQWIEESYRTLVEKITGEIEYPMEYEYHPYLSEPFICNGRLFASLHSMGPPDLVEIDITEPSTLEIKALELEVPFVDSHSGRLKQWFGESQGDMFIIQVVYGGVEYEETIDVGVFKLDLSSSKRQWRKVKGSEVKDRAFFLSNDNQLLSCTATGQGFEGGHVYYTLNRRNRLCCDFDVEDGSVTASLPPRSSFSPVAWVLMSHLRDETNAAKEKEKSEPLDSERECNQESFCDLLPIAWREREGPSAHEQIHSLPPLLMFSKSDRGMHHFIDPTSRGTFTVGADKSLNDAKIRFSKNGWVLMTDIGENSFFFYNPFTRQTIKLPQAPHATANCDSLCFTHTPSSPECVVLGVDFTGFHYFDTKKQEWEYTMYSHFDEFPDDLSIHSTPVFFKGAFYFLGTKGSLSKLVLEGLDLTIYNTLYCPCEDFCQNFLLEWDGKLVSVFINNKWTALQVFTLNEEKMVWEEATSLGKYSMFLSRFSAFCVVMGNPKMENKIYLSKIYDKDNILFYCLGTKRFGYALGEKRMKSFRGTKEYLSSCWMEPS